MYQPDQLSADVMPVSGDTRTPAGSTLSAGQLAEGDPHSTVVMFPLLSISFTAGGVMIPASATQIGSPSKSDCTWKIQPGGHSGQGVARRNNNIGWQSGLSFACQADSRREQDP